MVFYLKFRVFLYLSCIAIQWFFPQMAICISRLSVFGCDEYHFNFGVVLILSPFRDFHCIQLCEFVSYLNSYTPTDRVFTCYICSSLMVFPRVSHVDISVFLFWLTNTLFLAFHIAQPSMVDIFLWPPYLQIYLIMF